VQLVLKEKLALKELKVRRGPEVLMVRQENKVPLENRVQWV
jgi:hypothetical protein